MARTSSDAVYDVPVSHGKYKSYVATGNLKAVTADYKKAKRSYKDIGEALFKLRHGMTRSQFNAAAKKQSRSRRRSSEEKK